jgi:hypothetical protein
MALVGALAGLGAAIAVPVGLIGRLLIPGQPQTCSVPAEVPAERPTSPLARRLWGLFGLACWGLALFGALKVCDVPGEFSHGLCGVWGCLPPLQALAAMHLFWLVLLLPLGVLVGLYLPPGIARAVGLGVAAFATGLALTVVGRDVLNWMALVPDQYHVHAWRRALYALAIQTTLPGVQLSVAGALCWGVGLWRAP